MRTPEVFVHADGAAGQGGRRAARHPAGRRRDAAGHAHLVLTGGGIGTTVLAELAAAPARDAVDWRRVDFWWGDERFAADRGPGAQRDGRACGPARHVDVDPARVHPMPRPDGPDGDDPDAAAARYAARTRRAPPGPRTTARCRPSTC